MGTPVLPPASRVVSPAIHEIVAADGSFIATSAVEVSQVMPDNELKKSEDFEAAVARANSVLLGTLEPDDIMATMMPPSPATEWAKLAFDYAAVSTSMATIAKTRFNDFNMLDGGTLVQILRRFD